MKGSFRVADSRVDAIFINTSAFLGTNPADEPITSVLPVIHPLDGVRQGHFRERRNFRLPKLDSWYPWERRHESPFHRAQDTRSVNRCSYRGLGVTAIGCGFRPRATSRAAWAIWPRHLPAQSQLAIKTTAIFFSGSSTRKVA